MHDTIQTAIQTSTAATVSSETELFGPHSEQLFHLQGILCLLYDNGLWIVSNHGSS